MGGISPSAAARFMIRFRSKIIERLSLPVQIADYLLDKKVLSDELYQRICDASSSQDQVRKLYHASSGNLAKFHFYKALEKCDPFLFKSLKAKEKKNMKKREGSAPSDDQPSAKRLRTQEAAATAAGAEQNQGREARNEGEPGSRLKFRTFSEMEEHIKDPTVREELIKKLKMKLEGGEVERLERLLAEMKLKTPVCFDHKAVREIQTNQVVRAFLLPGEKKKFPFLVTNQCFIKIRGLAPQGSNAKDLAETQEGQEWSHANPRNSANIKKNIARCQNMLSPPSAEPCSAVQDARAYSTPIGQGTPFGSNAHTFSRREQEDSVTELSARGDSLSSSGYGSLILHPTEEAAGEASCTGPATPPAANQQLPQTPATPPAANQQLPQTPATPPAANQQLPQTPATPPAANSQLFGTPAEGDGSQQVSNGGVIESLRTEDSKHRGGESPALSNRAEAVISADPEVWETQTNGDSAVAEGWQPCTAAELSEQAGGYQHDNQSAEQLPAPVITECSGPSAGNANGQDQLTPAPPATVTGPSNEMSAAPDEGRFSSEAEKPKRRNKGQGRQKKIHSEEEKKKSDGLWQWALNQIPSGEKGGSEREKLVNIRGALSIVNIQEHPHYPFLHAEPCLVFRDPKNHNNLKIIENQVTSQGVQLKSGKLKSEVEFKVQFHMALFGISETVVLLPGGDKKVVRNNGFFEETEQHLQRYLKELFLPVFAFFKDLQMKKALSSIDEYLSRDRGLPTDHKL